MHDAISRELLYAARHRWPPWITDRDPPSTGTYLTRIVNRDGARYVQCHYWSSVSREWSSISQCWHSVEGWMEAPQV